MPLELEAFLGKMGKDGYAEPGTKHSGTWEHSLERWQEELGAQRLKLLIPSTQGLASHLGNTEAGILEPTA